MKLDRTQQPPIESFGSLAMPMPQIEQLPNGSQLYIVDKGDQEVCRIDFLFDGGRYSTPNPAIADLTGPMLRKGTPQMDNDAIAEHLDYHGAWLQTATTQHFSTLSLFSLNRNLDKILPTVVDMITMPTMPEKHLEILRRQRIQQLQINHEKVRNLAGEAFNKLIFGAQHPYARVITAEHLNDIQVEDLRQYHNSNILHTGTRILLSGRITSSVATIVKECVGNIPVQATHDVPCIEPFTPQEEHNAFVHKPGALQSGIRIGMPVIGTKHPDYPYLSMLNLILGGYFGSRLMSNIREEKGYTYGISSHIISTREDAYFTIVTETGTEYTQLLIDEVYKEIERLCNEPVPQDELETARNYLQGRRARALDSAFSMSDYFLSSIVSDTPLDYFNSEDQAIRNATAKDLLRVAQTHLQPHNLYIAIAGEKA